MNYFAHGLPFLDDPYFVAGTAVPDWLSVVDRKVRVRSRDARRFIEDDDQQVAAVARGIVQHHDDDGWFHTTEAFASLCWRFTARVRDVLGGDKGMRPSFLGHILVEILLDAVLIEEQPDMLDAYYLAMARVEPPRVGDAVNRMSARSADRLGEFVALFCQSRFLYDYTDDGKLCYRLNQVMRRVNLAPLPDEFQSILPETREDVRQHKDKLLTKVE